MRSPVLVLLFLLTVGARGAETVVVDLWPGVPPEEGGNNIGAERVRMSPGGPRTQVEVTEPTRLITGVTKPTLTIFSPAAGKNSGAAMIICPGGGYWDLYWQIEGEEVAEWLNSIGVTGIILKYRVPRRADEPKGEPARRPLQDAQRAVSLVRQRAKEWNIKPDRIGMVGFSAGGHLVVATGTNFDKRSYPEGDEIDKVSCRPDFVASIYPGYLKATNAVELASFVRVPKESPPMFFVHGDEDLVSPPENSVLMYLALKRAGVSAEVHIYGGTSHDFGVRRAGRNYASWMKSCEEWMRGLKVLGGTESGKGN